MRFEKSGKLGPWEGRKLRVLPADFSFWMGRTMDPVKGSSKLWAGGAYRWFRILIRRFRGYLWGKSLFIESYPMWNRRSLKYKYSYLRLHNSGFFKSTCEFLGLRTGVSKLVDRSVHDTAEKVLLSVVECVIRLFSYGCSIVQSRTWGIRPPLRWDE